MYYQKTFIYENADFNGDFSPKLAKVRDWLKTWRTQHKNLFVCGNCGCGKTYLAMAFLNELSKSTSPISIPTGEQLFYIPDIEYTTSKALFDTIRRKFSRDFEIQRRAEDDTWQFTVCKLLIVDEFGLGYGTESELIELTELLDERWKAGKPTVFISNITMQEIAKYLGERGRQRAFDGASYVEITDTVKRTKPQEL